jgi:hypothetical protein
MLWSKRIQLKALHFTESLPRNKRALGALPATRRCSLGLAVYATLLPADKIWKVRTIVTKVKERFKRFMPAPGEHLSADEAMVLFTGNR